MLDRFVEAAEAAFEAPEVVQTLHEALVVLAELPGDPDGGALAFLFVVFALTWVLARDAVRAGPLREKVERAQRD